MRRLQVCACCAGAWRLVRHGGGWRLGVCQRAMKACASLFLHASTRTVSRCMPACVRPATQCDQSTGMHVNRKRDCAFIMYSKGSAGKSTARWGAARSRQAAHVYAALCLCRSELGPRPLTCCRGYRQTP
eukprot:XP_001690153.1 predicted protein [Chlamydomonas reinhardtii]